VFAPPATTVTTPELTTVPAKLPATPPEIVVVLPKATRVPSTYAVSGSNIKVSTGEHIGKLTAGSATAAATLDVGTYEMNTVGSAFSLTESWQQGDAIPAIGSGVDVSTGVVADMPAFGSTTTISGGVAGNLAGTVVSSGVVTVVAGGANTTAVGQVTNELTVR
jgi:hypothetical protein